MKFVDLILRCKLALISSSLLLILPAAAAAQTAGTGALTGTVTDSNGAVVSEVQIKVTSDATGEVRTVASQSSGTYVVPLLLPGTYTVEFMKSGFKTAVKAALEVIVTETARLDVQLEAGGVQEKVTITADAPLLQTESPALGRVTDRDLVNNLPLVTRNYTQIVTLSPGIAANVVNATDLGRGSGGNVYRDAWTSGRDEFVAHC